jgi:hypothetical protein
MVVFSVFGNSLTGSLPASLSAWKKVKAFGVQGNKFTGVVPDVDFGGMTGGAGCYLLDNPATNSFHCPWPPGVTENCKKIDYGTSTSSPITNADCHGTAPPTPPPTPPPSYKCTAGQCAVAATGASKADCEALCTPLLFACTNNTCMQASAGVPRATCEGACGPAQQRAAAPLLLE